MSETASDRPLIAVSPAAARRIRAAGGRLFLWQTGVGRGWTRDHQSLGTPPTGSGFECRSVGDIDICLAADLEPVAEVVVRVRRWPWRGVRVYVDGRRWGWRGDEGGVVSP